MPGNINYGITAPVHVAQENNQTWITWIDPFPTAETSTADLYNQAEIMQLVIKY